MMRNKYKQLDLELLKNKKNKVVSSEVALEEIEPIKWSEAVLSGKKKVIINNQ